MEENKKEENVEETTEKETKKGSWFKNTWDTIYNKLGLKKLLIISYIALGVIVIALIISVSVVGAKNGDLKKQSSNGNGNVSYSKKEEKLFTEWKKGITTSIDYIGPMVGTRTTDYKTTKGTTVTGISRVEEKEVILSDGQYAYENKTTEVEYNTDGTKDEKSTDEYTIIKNTNGKYQLFRDEAEYVYTVDDKYYTEFKGDLELYLTSSSNIPAYIASDAEKLENVSSNIMLFYANSYARINNWNTSISKGKDGVTLKFEYTVSYSSSSAYITREQTESYTIKDNKLTKIYGKTVMLDDELNDDDMVGDYEMKMDFSYKPTEEDFNSIVSGKTVPTQNGVMGADVDYYINGALYHSEDANVGEKVQLFPYTATFDWYTDEACTKKYNDEVIPANDLKLYAKSKSTIDVCTIVFVKNVSYKYPNGFPNSLKEEDYATANVFEFELNTISNVAGCISNEYSGYTGRITMDGKDYTLDELKTYNFEIGKIYYINSYAAKNGMYY